MYSLDRFAVEENLRAELKYAEKRLVQTYSNIKEKGDGLDWSAMDLRKHLEHMVILRKAQVISLQEYADISSHIRFVSDHVKNMAEALEAERKTEKELNKKIKELKKMLARRVQENSHYGKVLSLGDTRDTKPSETED
jgi:chromosome segregation ATPase